MQSMRLWARRAPARDRGLALVGAFAVCAVLAVLMVPAGSDDQEQLASTSGPGAAGPVATGPGGGAATTVPGDTPAVDGGSGGGAAGGQPGSAGEPGSGSSGPVSPGEPGAPAAGAGGGGAAQPGTSGACTSPPGGDQGITDETITFAIALVNVFGPAANDAFGIPNPEQQEIVWNTVFDGINKQGGIACRRLVARYYRANPADPGDLQAKCLDIVASKPFAVIDSGSYSQGNPLCFSEKKLPYFGGFMLTERQQAAGYPYLFNLGLMDQVFKDTIFGFAQRGAFDPANGFNKLGIFYHDCHPELIEKEFVWIDQVGLDRSKVIAYNFGCPTSFANPSDVTQAVVDFKNQGVTHVTAVDAKGDVQIFTNIAEQQSFRPQYVFGDDQILGIAYGSLRPNSANIVNAQIVTPARSGEERTPGMTPTDATRECDAIFVAAGLPPTWKQHQLGGNACNVTWMIRTAVQNAPVLQRNALATGLARVPSIPFSYPSGPNVLGIEGRTTAGQFWRVAQFFAECDCWRVIDPEFKPNF